MRLKDCNLDLDFAEIFPPVHKSAEDTWLTAYYKKIIPETLHKFYVVADYFSIDKCPKFLQDDQKILFPHLEVSVKLIKSSFEEYHELIVLMKKYDAVSFNPIKKRKEGEFDKDAQKNFNRYFQILIINMYSILDSTAEAIAVILGWGKIGRSEFSKLVKETKDNKTSSVLILSFEDKYINDIMETINKDIIGEDNEKWFELFKLYRNKLAHFRHYSGIMLPDNDNNYYHFLPRRWPYYFQQNIEYGEIKKTDYDLSKIFHELLIEQDIFEYCQGLHNKIYNLTNNIFNVLLEAFRIKKETDCEINKDIKEQASSLIEIYDFKHF
jgi:hypothetical protein